MLGYHLKDANQMSTETQFKSILKVFATVTAGLIVGLVATSSLEEMTSLMNERFRRDRTNITLWPNIASEQKTQKTS